MTHRLASTLLIVIIPIFALSCKNPGTNTDASETVATGMESSVADVASAVPVAPPPPLIPRLHSGKNADLLNELETSRVQLLNMVRGTSPDQWTFRESSDRWSIAEITEHMVSAERLFRTIIVDGVLQGAENETAAQRRVQTDDEVLAFIRNRSNGMSAPSQLVPAGVYETVSQGIEAFERERAKTIELVAGTTLNLRGYSKPFPGSELSPMDAYQWFLYISGHTTRHVDQIMQVRANNLFPR
jgi:hypothetical protein